MFSGRKELLKWEAEGNNSILLQTRWLLKLRIRQRFFSPINERMPHVSAFVSACGIQVKMTMDLES